MSRDGNGVYSLPVNSWNPAVDGNAATTVDWQALIDDVAAAITQSVSSDGQTPMTGDLDMNGNRVENVANGVANTDGASVAQIYSQGVETSIASAATTDIGAVNSNFLNITGTTTITSLGTNYNGPRFVRFSGVLTLTYNATTLILPSGQNITTAAGDRAIFVPKGSPSDGWNCVYYEATSTTLKVGRGTLPANTAAVIDRLGTGTIPSLTAGTALTLVGASSASSPVYHQLISGTTGVAGVQFGDNDAALRATIEYNNNGEYLRAITDGTTEIWRGITGNFLVGATAAQSAGTTTTEGFTFGVSGTVACTMSRSGNPVLTLQRTTSDGAVANFYRQTTLVGSISVTGAATAYNTSSDYRLWWKEGHAPINNSGEFIDALNPRYFPKVGHGGFIAHEFQNVSPSSVTGVKDAVDEKGDPIYQQMDSASPEVMANIIAELKSLRKRVSDLENGS